MASGRLVADAQSRTRAWREVLLGVALAWLPDVDVSWVLLGVRDHGIFGHRGFTHTPAFALTVGAALGFFWWARGRAQPLRAALVAALVVGSHSVLDALAQDGRGMMFLWPWSSDRFHMLWRPIPDTPIDRSFFGLPGLRALATEFVYFLPCTLFALRQRREAGAPTLVARLQAAVRRQGVRQN